MDEAPLTGVEGGLELVLDVEGLAVGFPGDQGIVQVLDDVSLRVSRGRTLSLVGESGSGKSVTSLAIMGLLGDADARIAARRLRLRDREGRVAELATASEAELRRSRSRDNGLLGRWAEPREVAYPVLFLACGESSFVTGATLMVDAGRSIL